MNKKKKKSVVHWCKRKAHSFELNIFMVIFKNKVLDMTYKSLFCMNWFAFKSSKRAFNCGFYILLSKDVHSILELKCILKNLIHKTESYHDLTYKFFFLINQMKRKK